MDVHLGSVVHHLVSEVDCPVCRQRKVKVFSPVVARTLLVRDVGGARLCWGHVVVVVAVCRDALPRLRDPDVLGLERPAGALLSSVDAVNAIADIVHPAPRHDEGDEHNNHANQKKADENRQNHAADEPKVAPTAPPATAPVPAVAVV